MAKDVRKIQDLSDRELAENLYKYVKQTESNTSIIKVWVIIWSVIAILGVVITLGEIYG